ncbi:MAG: RNA methyltransferase [Bdellovibrionales bacterium]|nr:RNA methyltransferase [Bdellovibrionales bacterium]
MSLAEEEELEDVVTRSVRRTFFESEPFLIGGAPYTAAELWQILGSRLTVERQQRILEVCRRRSQALVPVLENIYDRGNISAVMRSAEAFGFYRFQIIDVANAKFKAANRVTKGSDKWLQVEPFSDVESCVQRLKGRGYKIYATHLEASVSIEEIDFTQPSAVVFGNEKEGVSKQMLDLVDGRFVLPMLGFSQSFNISVAASLTFSYVHYAQKKAQGGPAFLSEREQQILAANYALRSFDNPEALLKELKTREK